MPADAPPLVHFAGPLSAATRAALRNVLRRAESTGTFPRYSLHFGARWVVVTNANAPTETIAITRLGTSLGFAGHSPEAIIQQIKAWIETQSPPEPSQHAD